MAPKVEAEGDVLAGYERGKPAPATLYGVMGADGVEREVSTKAPERGHVLVQAGESVEQYIVLRIEAHQAYVADKAAKAAAEAAAAEEEKAEPDSTDDGVNASDAAVVLAKANDIDLASVAGSGAGGKVTKGDVEAAVKAKAESQS